MKLLHALFISLPFLSFSQKANDDVTRRSFSHMVYPQDETLSAKIFGMTVNENVACFGTIPGRVYTSPLTELDPRSRFYLNLVPAQRGFFMPSRDLIHNMLKSNEKFIHIEMETSDLYLSKQTTKNTLGMSSNPQYYLSFEGKVLINLTITSEGENPVTMVDTNTNSSASIVEYHFPLDGTFVTQAADTKVGGYPTEAELLAAWKKYGADFVRQWHDKFISDFATGIFWHFKQEKITHEDWVRCKIYSDKNKKGGYDNIVEAAKLFNDALDSIDVDYKKGDFRKFWKAQHQEKFVKAGKIWNDFLAQSNFDVTVDDALISDHYRQNILLNYIYAQVFAGNFTKANELIETYSQQKLRSFTLLHLAELAKLNKFFEEEFNVHAAEFGWVRATETF